MESHIDTTRAAGARGDLEAHVVRVPLRECAEYALILVWDLAPVNVYPMWAGCARRDICTREPSLIVCLTVPLGEAVREGKGVVFPLRNPTITRDGPRPCGRIRDWSHDWKTGVGIAARVGVG